MPIYSPKPSRRQRGRRSQPAPRPVRPENEIHDRRDAERIEELASLSLDTESPIETIEEFLTVADLLSFAASTSLQPLVEIPNFAPTSATGDTSYVADAQGESNPALSSLGGLAQNTYDLKMAVAQAFSISPKSIGGRAYRPYRSDHTTGHAIDIPGSGDRGQAIADWVITQAARYKVKYIIFNYRIWYPGKGWQRYNPSSGVRGFASDAGHVRHVHVSTY